MRVPEEGKGSSDGKMQVPGDMNNDERLDERSEVFPVPGCPYSSRAEIRVTLAPDALWHADVPTQWEERQQAVEFRGGYSLAPGRGSLLPVRGTTERLPGQYPGQSTALTGVFLPAATPALRGDEGLEVCRAVDGPAGRPASRGRPTTRPDASVGSGALGRGKTRAGKDSGTRQLAEGHRARPGLQEEMQWESRGLAAGGGWWSSGSDGLNARVLCSCPAPSML